MIIEEKQRQLFDLYDKYAELARPYLASAICRKSCASCCITVGNVDIATLEGLIILKHLKGLEPSTQKELAKKLKQNRNVKKQSKFARCAFLQTDNCCSIYPLRPFSCRRLYSIQPCAESGPAVHRQAWEAAEQIRLAIQQLDDTGYTGHLSCIIQLLGDAKFLRTYLAGEFSPEDIKPFALSHNIFINRFAQPPHSI